MKERQVEAFELGGHEDRTTKYKPEVAKDDLTKSPTADPIGKQESTSSLTVNEERSREAMRQYPSWVAGRSRSPCR